MPTNPLPVAAVGHTPSGALRRSPLQDLNIDAGRCVVCVLLLATHKATLPRRRSPASCSGQFATQHDGNGRPYVYEASSINRVGFDPARIGRNYRFFDPCTDARQGSNPDPASQVIMVLRQAHGRHHSPWWASFSNAGSATAASAVRSRKVKLSCRYSSTTLSV